MVRRDSRLAAQLLDIDRSALATDEGLRREAGTLEEMLHVLRERARVETDPAQVEAIRARADALELAARERALLTIGPDPNSWGDQWRRD